MVLKGMEAHHASRVLRMEVGDTVVVLDGAGKAYHCAVISSSKASVTLEVRTAESQPPPVGRIRLIAGIPKGQLFDEIVERATELGVSEIIPLMTERGNVRLNAQDALGKQEKWQTTAREALKQSGNLWVPSIQLPIAFNAVLAQNPPADLALVAALVPGAQEVRVALEAHRQRSGSSARSLSIWVGPEGDFTPQEYSELARRGVLPITLGPWALRCPTAVVSVVAILAHELRCSDS